jgi:hypothetical protein
MAVPEPGQPITRSHATSHQCVQMWIPCLMKVDLAPLVRFIQHLPKNGDTELALLKCHLLIEEVLTRLIARAAKNPALLPKARLTFAQKVWMARSLTDLETQAWAWEALKNELAHALEVSEVNKKVEEFTLCVERYKGIPPPEVIGGPLGRFQLAAFMVFSFLAGQAHFDPTGSPVSAP